MIGPAGAAPDRGSPPAPTRDAPCGPGAGAAALPSPRRDPGGVRVETP